jgi:S-adenosyl-L-methionine hydrolase (adenosine-forming)
MTGEFITFLSDYGVGDTSVGVCHGVIARHAPHARVVDLCHTIAPQDIPHGATKLAAAVGYLPACVHLAVIEPVTADGFSRGVAVRTTDGSTFVAPDNGLTSLAWEELGGVASVHEIADPGMWLPRPSDVFRGRDVYAPVAARLATGTAVDEVGPAVDPETLVRVVPRRCEVDSDHVHGEVVDVDHFGNLSLNAARTDLEAAGLALGDPVELRLGGRALQVRYTHTYGEVPPGRVVVCEDSLHRVMIAVNLGRATDILRAGRGEAVVIAQAQREPAVIPAPEPIW